MPPRKQNSTKPKRNNAPKAPRAPRTPKPDTAEIAARAAESAIRWMDAQTAFMEKAILLLDLYTPLAAAAAQAMAIEAEKATGPVADA